MTVADWIMWAVVSAVALFAASGELIGWCGTPGTRRWSPRGCRRD